MNIGFSACAVMFIPDFIFGILFAVLKEKSAKLVSGFNSMPKEKQEKYDKAYIARDMRNQCFVRSAIMLAGAILSLFVSKYMAIPAFVIWLVLFLKQVHFDSDKAFEKYLK
ncbi:MAG: DUF3784 domain-containing protein [Clostridia bacterium]|nr:DUF3784 domain-containing protein [Clostridia bacterium]